jgi:hypothetical protein
VLVYQSHKKLDFFPKRPIFILIIKQFSLPVNFQPNPNLPEMAMKECHLKVLEVKPLGDNVSLLEAFSFWG